jgi:hypothetical protein
LAAVAIIATIGVANVSASPADAPKTAPKGSVVAQEARKPASSTTTPPETTVPVLRFDTPESAQCPQWWPLAAAVGFPLEELPQLDRIIWRESRCQPDAFNGHDAGLTQINQIHREFVAVMGWTWPQDMFEPEPALRFTLKLWQGSGWRPWGF